MTTSGLAGFWYLWEPPPYRSTEGQEVNAADRYAYQPDSGCSPQEIGQLVSPLDRETQRRECANQAQDHRRELDDLTQQTRAAEGVEKGNWIALANYRLAVIQLFFSAAGAAGLIYSLILTSKATNAAVKQEGIALAAVREAQRSNEIAAANAATDARPWLHVEVVEINSYLLVDNNSSGVGPKRFSATAVLRVENTGKTPARNAYIHVGTYNDVGVSALISRSATFPGIKGYEVLGVVPPSAGATQDYPVVRDLEEVPDGGNSFVTRLACVLFYDQIGSKRGVHAPPFRTLQTFVIEGKHGDHTSHILNIECVRSKELILSARAAPGDMT